METRGVVVIQKLGISVQRLGLPVSLLGLLVASYNKYAELQWVCSSPHI
jgi:hypothetical protein